MKLASTLALFLLPFAVDARDVGDDRELGGLICSTMDVKFDKNLDTGAAFKAGDIISYLGKATGELI